MKSSQNRLSFTSGLLLVIMCAILCAGLCFSIVLFEDQLDVASALNYTDINWVNISSISTSSNVAYDLIGYNAFYIKGTSSLSNGSRICDLKYNTPTSTGSVSKVSYLSAYSNKIYLSTSSGLNSYLGSYGFAFTYNFTAKSDIIVFPYGLVSVSWLNNAFSIVDLYVANITLDGSFDPDDYVSIDEYEQLQADYDALQDDLDELQDTYDSLSQDYLDLQSNYQVVLDMNSDYAANLQQKRAELNLMYNNLSMLVMWINGVFIGNDESGTSQYTPEFEEYLESLGYDLDNFLYTDINDVVYDLRPIIKQLQEDAEDYAQLLTVYNALLEEHNYLSGKYDDLVNTLEFTQLIGASENTVQGLDGTSILTLGDQLLMATNSGTAKVKMNLVATVRAGTEILITYSFGSSISDFSWYPTTVSDNSQTLFTTVDGLEHTFSYVPTSDVSYFTFESTNPDYTTSSMIIDFEVNTRVSDITAVYDVGYHKGFGEGESKGFTDGKKEGYTIGFREGKMEDNTDPTFTNMIGALVDVPVNALFGKYDVQSQQRVGGLFNFEILGVNLAAFFLSLLSLSIILFIIKFALLK